MKAGLSLPKTANYICYCRRVSRRLLLLCAALLSEVADTHVLEQSSLTFWFGDY